MSTIGADAAIIVDAEQDAHVLLERTSLRPGAVDVEDQLASETSPLLPHEADNGDYDFPDSINKPWLGSREFNAKPWWRRPSIWWVIPPTALFTLAFGGVAVPRINLVLAIVCRDYFADQKAKDPTFTFLPVIFGEDNDQCRIPQVQSNVAQLLLVVNIISGGLAALASPRLGELSDRYGRITLMTICVFSTLISEVFTVVIAAYPETASVNWLFVSAFVDGLGGSFTLALSLVHSYGADCTSPERRNVVFGLFHATLFTGVAFGPLVFGLLMKYTGSLLDIFIAVLVCHFIYFLTLAFIVPESLSKERQMVARTKHLSKKPQEEEISLYRYMLRELHPAKIFKPLDILFPKLNPSESAPEQRTLFRKLRTNLILIASIDTLMFGISFGTVQIIILYAEYVFGWGTYESSVFVSVANLGRVITLIVILPTVTRLVRGPQEGTQTNSGSDWLDIACIRLSIVVELIGYIGYATSTTGAMFTLSAVIASIGGIGSPTSQSSLTKHVPPSQTGRILGAMGLLHALARVVAPIILNLIYSATVGSFTQTVFVCLSSVFGFVALLSWFIIPGVYLPESSSSNVPESEDSETLDS